MKPNQLNPSTALAILVLITQLAGVSAYGVLTTNNWSDGSSKWELGANWSAGVPSPNNAITFVQGGVPVGSRLITIDVATIFSNVANNCLTVSNLVLGGSSTAPNTLFLQNTDNDPSGPPMHIVNNCTVSPHGFLTITNSTLILDGGSANLDLGLIDNSFITLNSGKVVCRNSHIGDGGQGNLSITGGIWSNNNVCFVPYNSGDVGTISMSGGTAVFSNIGPDLGDEGTGMFWLTGGFLFANDLSVGSGGVGQMVVSNGTATLNEFDIGTFLGNGSVNIVGGTVVVGALNVGGESGSAGNLWLNGGKLVSTNALVQIAGAGQAQTTVSNGLLIADNIQVGNLSGPGSMNIAGGQTRVHTKMQIGLSQCAGYGNVTVSAGSLYVTNAAHNSVLDIECGAVYQTGGNIVVDDLIITNGSYYFTGGSLTYSTLVYNPNGDIDGDGIPNLYEDTHGLNPLDPRDGSADNDGDGMSNLQEYLANTDPNNAASYFHIISATRTNTTNLLISWMTGPGRTNALQATSGDGHGGYDTNSFTTICTITNTTGTTTNFLDIGAATNAPARYYRVSVLPNLF